MFVYTYTNIKNKATALIAIIKKALRTRRFLDICNIISSFGLKVYTGEE
jgi:hypothetical protein